MARLKKMLIPVEQAMMASAFAEEGEFATAISLVRNSRRVLLALREGKADSKTLKYAMNAAKRINAQLDILNVMPPQATQAEENHAVEAFLPELQAAGIPFRVVRRTGCLKEQIIEHTTREKEVLFTVIESPAQLEGECRKSGRELSELWRTLKCPLVVVMDAAS
ncbi:MAG TPA: hypothetical protein VK654_04335 [Nitrospirota bacterium]|nr:hypothetical protein [Nitrospirota bacterium]